MLVERDDYWAIAPGEEIFGHFDVAPPPVCFGSRASMMQYVYSMSVHTFIAKHIYMVPK